MDCNEIKFVSKESLIRAIQNHIKSKYKSSRLGTNIYGKWKVGVTNDSKLRYKQNLPKGKTRLTYWKCWNARSLKRALAVEQHFCGKGFIKCRNTGFETEDSFFVYVYRVSE